MSSYFKYRPAFVFLLMICFMLHACQESTEPMSYASFDEYPIYNGKDLGVHYQGGTTTFKVWAPTAEAVEIRLYEQGLGGQPLQTRALDRKEEGVWATVVTEDLLHQFYTFRVKISGEWLAEVPDPYARAVGANGKRGMIVDLAETNPEGWERDTRPPLAHFNDIIIYELQVRDVSMHPNSGIQHQGKFLGLTELGTTSPDGESTGLDHIKDLGVTHIHLLPSYDFLSIDETELEQNKFNWGYDPHNYNVPEGSFSTDPADGQVRIKEFKQLVQTLHENGLRVILDVVYNHTGATENSNFNQLVPGYYYRHNEDGSFSNASACGNETASERAMMRKFMLESVQYWVEEYHLDGFRFDLMGIHDIETMNQISTALHAIDPSIFIYGEGWTAGDSPLPDSLRALKAHTPQLKQIAAFSDEVRDAIKGHVFTPTQKAFVSGRPGLEESVKFGIVAATQHPQVNYDSVNYSDQPWAKEPSQTITYVSCHDNHTLWDRLAISCPEASEAERIAMHKLAGMMVLTAQGVPFLHAGVEMLRTKNGIENSFESPDSINRLDWSRKTAYKPVYDYYRKLIELRKAHPAFRLRTTEQIQQHVQFMDFSDRTNLVGYTIRDHANGDTWKNIVVVYNGNATAMEIALPAGSWQVVANAAEVEEGGIGPKVADQVAVPGRSGMILIQ